MRRRRPIRGERRRKARYAASERRKRMLAMRHIEHYIPYCYGTDPIIIDWGGTDQLDGG